MVPLRSQPSVIVIAVALAVAVGCAKQPVRFQSKPEGSSAPAPTVAGPTPESLATPREPSAGAVSPGDRSAAREGVQVPARPQSTGPSTGAGRTTAGMGQRPPLSDFTDSDALKDIYFDFDKYDIRPEAATTLVANAAWLKEHPGSSVLVEGHCDARGTTEYNLALGQRRAQAARDFLMAQGVPGSRIATISYGKERPTCAESTESCRAGNRRAHFLVRPS